MSHNNKKRKRRSWEKSPVKNVQSKLGRYFTSNNNAQPQKNKTKIKNINHQEIKQKKQNYKDMNQSIRIAKLKSELIM